MRRPGIPIGPIVWIENDWRPRSIAAFSAAAWSIVRKTALVIARLIGLSQWKRSVLSSDARTRRKPWSIICRS